MKRKPSVKLLSWKNNKNHKPLIIFGARQVGKTYLAHDFARSHYDNIYEINFGLTLEANWILEDNLNVDNLLIQFSAYNPSTKITEKAL